MGEECGLLGYQADHAEVRRNEDPGVRVCQDDWCAGMSFAEDPPTLWAKEAGDNTQDGRLPCARGSEEHGPRLREGEREVERERTDAVSQGEAE